MVVLKCYRNFMSKGGHQYYIASALLLFRICVVRLCLSRTIYENIRQQYVSLNLATVVA